MKCLLLELKDKRKFFTSEKNLYQLVEFCKSFQANISLVDVKNCVLMNLEELVFALCNNKINGQNSEYVFIENKLISKKKEDKKTIASKLKTFIRKKFLSKSVVDLFSIRNKFRKYKISNTSLYNCLKNVKNDLEKEGYNIVKEKTGCYRIS